MPEHVTKEAFNRLEGRVDVLEREVEGEKMVTRHILEHTRRNGDELAGIKTKLGKVDDELAGIKTRLDRIQGQLDGVEGRLGGVEGRLDGVEGRLAGVEAEVRGLRSDLPAIVGDTVRAVLNER